EVAEGGPGEFLRWEQPLQEVGQLCAVVGVVRGQAESAVADHFRRRKPGCGNLCRCIRWCGRVPGTARARRPGLCTRAITVPVLGAMSGRSSDSIPLKSKRTWPVLRSLRLSCI